MKLKHSSLNLIDLMFENPKLSLERRTLPDCPDGDLMQMYVRLRIRLSDLRVALSSILMRDDLGEETMPWPSSLSLHILSLERRVNIIKPSKFGLTLNKTNGFRFLRGIHSVCVLQIG